MADAGLLVFAFLQDGRGSFSLAWVLVTSEEAARRLVMFTPPITAPSQWKNGLVHTLTLTIFFLFVSCSRCAKRRRTQVCCCSFDVHEKNDNMKQRVNWNHSKKFWKLLVSY